MSGGRSQLDPPAAREAYDNALLLAALLLLWGALSLLSVPHPFHVLKNTQVVAGGAALVFLAWTRRRPHRVIAQVISVAITGYALLLLPWIAIAWAKLGRPLEALPVPQVGMLAMALVAPRRLWAGIGLVAAFAAETAFASWYAHHRGLGALMPTTEPYLTLMFATVGVYIVTLRRRRREQVLGLIRLQAESEALGRLEPLFATCRDELDDCLQTMRVALRHVDGPELGFRKHGMARALARIGDTRDRIYGLVGDEGAPDLADNERAFIAADAHSGATIMAASSSTLAVFFITLAAREHFPRPFLAAMVLVALTAFIYLLITRRRTPPRWQSAAFVLCLWAALLSLATAGEQLLARYAVARHQPFTPFIPHKLLLVTLPLVAPTLPWITLLISLTTTANALALYFLLHLHADTGVVSLAEPWTTLAFAFVGILLLGLREQRVMASIGLLRAESRCTALERRTRLLLALRDQLNSPLQALVLYVAQGAKRSSDGDQALREQVERLVAMSRRLASVEVTPAPVSFDAAEDLRRH